MTRKKKGFCDWFNLIAAIWIVISDIFLNAHCLRDLKIFVPEAVIMGHVAKLSCQYDLEEAPLYSVRWYFDNEEFYRYVPKELPPQIVFPVVGVTVDVNGSDSTSVTLRSVSLELTGQFRCEVSEDEPTFHTAIRKSFMQVVELPQEEPHMQIEKNYITVNDHLKAFCTVGKSFPSANITWYINGKKVKKNPFQRIVYKTNKNSRTFSSLELYPHSQLLQEIYQSITKYQTSFDVLCEVSIMHVYHRNVQYRVVYGITGANYSQHGTASPNLLQLDGSKRSGGGGDPDNSPLTGHATRTTVSTIIITTITTTTIKSTTKIISICFLCILYRIFL